MTLEEYAKQQPAEPAQGQEQPQRKLSIFEQEQALQKPLERQTQGVYKEYQANIKKVESLSAEIMKGMQKGENIATLFLKAARAYTLCTGNTAEYKIIEETVYRIYGKALHDSEVTVLAADAIRGRLERLQTALQGTTDREERSRLERCITEHNKELESLLKA